MIQPFAWDAETDQGYLFDPRGGSGAAVLTNDDAGRRPGETALDYRIRRQYRDVSATAPLFPPAHGGARR